MLNMLKYIIYILAYFYRFFFCNIIKHTNPFLYWLADIVLIKIIIVK